VVDRRQARRLRRRAVDNAALRIYHRAFRLPLLRYLFSGGSLTLATAPLVYGLALPFALLDLSVTLYQAVCFRAWGISRVGRRAYFAIDRHKLSYLNALEGLNCMYCSYANGVIGYVREIAARTEQYWCPIRHRRRIRHPHERYAGFVPYGDATGYRTRQASLRAALRK
jgi:hypothetical protein